MSQSKKGKKMVTKVVATIFVTYKNVSQIWLQPPSRIATRNYSLHLQSLFSTWTSGNKIIDDFIHQCQQLSSLPHGILEWIPFEQFVDVKKLTEGGFSSIYTATWTRGYLCDYNENKKSLPILDVNQ